MYDDPHKSADQQRLISTSLARMITAQNVRCRPSDMLGPRELEGHPCASLVKLPADDGRTYILLISDQSEVQQFERGITLHFDEQ